VKLVALLFSFLRELIFDSKEEFDFKSSKFNARKFTVLILIVFSLFLNLLFAQRLYSLARQNVELKNFIEIYVTNCYKNLEDSPSDRELLQLFLIYKKPNQGQTDA
jgi:hypothetical protein